MEFTLPNALAAQLRQYDTDHQLQQAEQRRQEAERQRRLGAQYQAQQRLKGNARPLGMPINIIPPDILPSHALERALTIINGLSAEHRHEHWLTDSGQFLAAVWHLTMPRQHGSCWMAAWANPERNGCYVRVMAKRSCAPYLTRIKLRQKVQIKGDAVVRLWDAEDSLFPATDEQIASGLWNEVTLPRATWWQRTWFFDEKTCATDPDFLHPDKLIDLTKFWSRRSAAAGHTFRDQTALRVLKYCATFLGVNQRDQSPFAACQSTPYLLACEHGYTPPATNENLAHLIANWRPSIEDLQLCERSNAPFFRAHFTRRIQTWLQHCDQRPRDLSALETEWKTIVHERKDLEAIHRLWPDITRDHVQSLFLVSIQGQNIPRPYDSHLRVRCLHRALTLCWTSSSGKGFLETPTSRGPSWIRENVPIETWIRWSHPDQRDDLRRALVALEKLAASDEDCDIPRPSRWRLEEVINLFEEQYFLRTTPNVSLPQDLFPAPVKLLRHGTKYTFFQPISAHQLYAWGSAVRNCVGNGSYADRVKRHQAFIVLAQVDNKPVFTVQLSLRDGKLVVDQLVGVANQRPSLDEQADYQEAMHQALELRAASLASDSLASV